MTDRRARNTTDSICVQSDGRLVSPSAERNRGPIIDALAPLLASASGMLLEIGSGTGQHAVALAAAFPDLDWQPSDPFDVHLDSISAWATESGLTNVRAPIWLDAAERWPDLGRLAGVLAINVIHIAPWAVAKGLVRGAAAALAKGAPLVFYGPFKKAGRHTSEGNTKFDALLRAEDPTWGVRDVDELSELACAVGLGTPSVTPMPSNNCLVCYRRS